MAGGGGTPSNFSRGSSTNQSFSFSPPCHVRVKSVPLLPMTSEPPSLVMSFCPWNSSGGGSLPPSYHVIFTAGRLPRAGNSRSMMLQSGAVSFVSGALVAGAQSRTATRVGVPSSRPQYAVSRLWMPMSPIAPVPKSQNPRHLNGTYVGWYGRSGAGPSHTSQSSVGGTGAVSVGRSTPCGHQPAGRSVQTCSSVTSPITPARSTSTARRVPSNACPCVPICVATREAVAAFAIWRTSQMLRASGFSLYTCLPSCIAAIDTMACE